MLNVVIGLVFVYLLYSLFATVIMEIISSALALRAKNLEKALQNMMQSNEVNFFNQHFKNHPLYRQLSGTNIKKKTPPSYLSPTAFSSILMQSIKKMSNGEGSLGDSIDLLPEGDFKKVVSMKYEEAENNVGTFKSNMENWFNDMMDRASGWYKRTTQVFVLLVGLGIAVGFNVDTLTVFSNLNNNSNEAQKLADQAASYVQARDYSNNAVLDGSERLTLSEVKAISDDVVKNYDTGIGWVHFELPKGNFTDAILFWFLKLIGWLVTATAISLGAPFWFDMLRKLVNVRGTGQAPTNVVVQNYSATSESSSPNPILSDKPIG